MCAIQAGKRSRKVLVLERSERVGKKILISGGGRCNFTNLNVAPENFLSANPHFCKSALSRYTPFDFLEWVKSHKIEYYEKKLGQLFCTGSAKQIVGMLLKESEAAGVEIRLSSQIRSIEKIKCFILETNEGLVEAEALVVATGGLSYAKLGATPLGYEIARQFGHEIQDCVPGLVPLTLDTGGENPWRELTGVSSDAVVSCKDQSFQENILFTHRGLSGPAILQISSYWSAGEAIVIDLVPKTDVEAMFQEMKRRGDRQEVKNILSGFLSKRFCELWCERHFASKPLAQCSSKELEYLATQLRNWKLTPQGTEGYETAEVTRGGVDTRWLSSKTMESTKIPGLYFIGEVVDVTGQLGGFNFQWAWASGAAAGRAI